MKRTDKLNINTLDKFNIIKFRLCLAAPLKKTSVSL